ncbi:MAG: ATP phosphoribosyltransferase regulatory subunit [Alphaproteobacteria bacterium]|nr:ATP phosphoribosyltransferase regulatory subunit [Alphaproteobacteria bacterium]
MSRVSTRALLPAGLIDHLPPDAAHAAEIVERLLACFTSHGYERVKPPMIEFEDTLLTGPAAPLAEQTFRLMDPVSQRMMGLRADITMQVARIATTRLAKAPRPLRLAYAGDVFRVRGAQLRPERQFMQIGFELIGAPSAAADVETILLATEALRATGIATISVDLNVPTLVPALCRKFGIDDGGALRDALDRKDAAAVAKAAGAHGELFGKLLAAAGPAAKAIKAIAALGLDGEAAADAERLAEVASRVAKADPALKITADPTEHRGFEYHTGVGFTLFAPRVRGELGSGGRYLAGGGGADDDGTGEPATGATLYLETIIRALPDPGPGKRLFLPAGTTLDQARALRDKGWTTLACLDPEAAPRAEAERLGCTHMFSGGKPVALGKKSRNPAKKGA